MSPRTKTFILQWLVNTFAVLVAVYLLGDHRIHYERWYDVLAASALLGVLNTFLRPLLLLLSLPLLVFTLGLFMLVINAGLLWLTGQLLQPHFRVADFKSAFWGALVISVVSLIVNSFTGTGSARFTIKRGGPPTQKPGSDKDDGPVIDV